MGFASFLAFTSLLLLIFVHVGQITTSTVPRGIWMVEVNMSTYGASLQSAIFNPIMGLYTSNASAPLQAGLGLRQFYKFGLYSYCGYISEKEGTCGNHTVGEQFTPFDAVISDMLPQNYSILTANLIPGNVTLRDSKYLGQSTKAAYWMLLLGTLCAALTLLTGIAKNHFTFFVSTIFAIAGSLLLLIGASIWTVLIKKSESVNHLLIPGTQIPSGISVSVGPGLFLTWAAFVALVVSIIPYMISCCTYRG